MSAEQINTQSPEIEQWKAVVGLEEIYEVSNLGRVRRIKSFRNYKAGHILKPLGNANGYFRVDLRNNKARYRVSIHRLVLESFIGMPPGPDYECNHRSGDPADNRLQNLEWVTRSENQIHCSWVLGRKRNVGAANGMSKLTDQIVLEIRKAAAVGPRGTRIRLARKYGITTSSIANVINRKVWKHI